MKFMYVLLAIAGGAVVPLQIGISNNLLSATGGTHWHSTFVLYLGGVTASLFTCLIAEGNVIPAGAYYSRWWMWSAGLLGMFYILFMFVSAPQLGVANTLVWMLFGQLICALILDSFGLLSMPVIKISTTRVLGIVAVLTGAVLLAADKG